MAVKIFVFALLSISIFSYFVPVDKKNSRSKNEDTPLLIFINSTMYTLNEEDMNRIVFSKKAVRYSSRDVMQEGSLLLKSFDKDNKVINDTLLADLIIKRGDQFKFLNDVQFTRNDYVTLNTDELIYNAKTRIATNTLPFEGNYFNHYIKGKSVYLDLNKYYMKSLNTHFEIEVQEKGNK